MSLATPSIEKDANDFFESTATSAPALTQTIETPLGIEGLTANQIADAYNAALAEHTASVKASLRIYFKAVLWISVIGLAIFQEQYDSAIFNNVQALPAFQKRFGKAVPPKDKSYQLTPSIQLALSNVGHAGHLIGIFFNGYLVDWIGQRRGCMLVLCLVMLNTFLLFFAKNIAMVLVGSFFQQALSGYVGNTAPAWGIELAPLALRPYAPLYVRSCQAFGSLVGSCVLQAFSSSNSDWAWRIPFGLEWCFPPVIMFIMYFAPESPWWLVRQGREQEALRNLRKLHNGQADDLGTVALIRYTTQLERQLHVGVGYLDLFRGINLRRTEISLVICAADSLDLFAIRNAAYFFEVAGLSASNAFALQSGQFALGIVAGAVSTGIIGAVGRRTLWFFGAGGLAALLATSGGLAVVPNQTPAVVWPQGALVLVCFFLASVGIGALSFLMTAEIGAAQLRQKTICIGRMLWDGLALVQGAVTPYLLNPTAANLKGKTAWITCGINVLILIYGYFRLPETRGRSTDELDMMFMNKVPARKFKTYIVSTEQEFGIVTEEKPGAEQTRTELAFNYSSMT